MVRKRSALAATLAAILVAIAAGCGGAATDAPPATTAPATAQPGDTAPPAEMNATELAASVWSNDPCEPKDPAAVADVPEPVDTVTGFDSAPGDWMALPETSPLTGKRIAVSVMGLGQPFFGAVAGHWKDLAERYDFDLKIYDGKFDAGTVQTLVDDIIADDPDGVAFAPLAADAAVPQVEKFQAAGIPVVTYNIQPAQPVAPRVIGFDYQSLLITGCNAGAYYNAKFGDTPAKIGIVHYSVLPQVQDRANGFLKGFLSQVPTAEVVAVVEGGAVIDKALPAASDLLQKNPEVNVLFGINNDSTLGIIGALKADNKYSSDWGVTASIDGSLPAVTELMNPDSPWKAESGYPPYDYAIQTFNLLGATLDGKADKDTQIALVPPRIQPTTEAAKEWVDTQYPER
jgi:ribose transport system substrate-binding protein